MTMGARLNMTAHDKRPNVLDRVAEIVAQAEPQAPSDELECWDV